MLAWFGSGMLMLFVPYPALEPTPAPPFVAAAVAAVALPPGVERVVEATLRVHQGQARWLLVGDDGHRALAGATTGDLLDGERIERPDQWTFNGSLRPYFPLLRRTLPDGTLEYRSQATGETVLRLSRLRRWAVALGPVVHWVYPTVLRRHAQAWQNVVLVLAGAGFLLCASGLTWSLWTRPGYRKQWLRLHHQLGLVFGVLGCTWTLSGALSFDPGNWSSGDWPDDDEAQRYYGGAALELGRFTRPPGPVAAACAARQPTGALTLVTPPHSWARADADGPLWSRPPAATLLAAAHALYPGVAIVSAVERDAPDAYYYATTRAPSLELPYLQVRYDDRAGSVAYVGLRSGELLRRYQRSGRWERWLFHGLHSWDWPPLYRHLVLWRATVLVLLLGGAALAASGVWMLGRRLRRMV
jgi:hypothetical protein